MAEILPLQQEVNQSIKIICTNASFKQACSHRRTLFLNKWAPFRNKRNAFIFTNYICQYQSAILRHIFLSITFTSSKEVNNCGMESGMLYLSQRCSVSKASCLTYNWALVIAWKKKKQTSCWFLKEKTTNLETRFLNYMHTLCPCQHFSIKLFIKFEGLQRF